MPPGPQRFHPRLLGRKPRRVTLVTVGLAFGVRDFALREDPLDKPLPVPRDRTFDARYLAQIHPGTHDHVVRVTESACRRQQECLSAVFRGRCEMIFLTLVWNPGFLDYRSTATRSCSRPYFWKPWEFRCPPRWHC